MEANKARYDSDVANMQAVFTNAVAKVMAENQGTVNITAGEINTVKSGVKETTGEIVYTVTDPSNEENSSGKIIFDKKDKEGTTYYTGKKLPVYSAGNTTWYVDEEGNVSLNVAGKKYGEGVITLEGVVIDYSLPVKLEYEKIGESKIVAEKCYVSYGEVKIEGDNTTGTWSVTYTLTKVLNDVDTIHLFAESEEEYRINIYPATSIYYEEDFADIEYVGNWVKDNTQHLGSGFQESSLTSTSVYGNDKEYKEDLGFSYGTAYKTYYFNNDTASTFDIEFKGTGIDLYSYSDRTSGSIMILLLKENSNKVQKLMVMDTKTSAEDIADADITNGYYQIPVISLRDLPYASYKLHALVGASKQDNINTFWLDGIRVYNTMGDDISAQKEYIKSNEGYPNYISLKSTILLKEEFAVAETIKGSVYIDKNGSSADYPKNGPKNEVYLSRGQKIAFRLYNDEYNNVDRVHLGAKSLDGKNAVVKISGIGTISKNLNIKTTSELYYDISECVIQDGDTSNIIVIENTSEEGVWISLTNLKVTHKNKVSSNTALVTLVEDANQVIGNSN